MALWRQPLRAVLRTDLASASQRFRHDLAPRTAYGAGAWVPPLLFAKILILIIIFIAHNAMYLHTIEAILIVMPACMNINLFIQVTATFKQTTDNHQLDAIVEVV